MSTPRTMTLRAIFALILVSFCPAPGLGAEGGVVLVRGKRPLPEVALESALLRVQDAKITVEIEGVFKSTGHSLLVQLKARKVDAVTGKFKVSVECTALSTPVVFALVSPKGTVRSETVQVTLKTEQDFTSFKRSLLEPPPRLTHLSGGLGMATLSYGQPGISEFSQVALSGKIGARRDIPSLKGWVDLNVYSTLLPLSSSIEGTSLRQIGVNLRGGRNLLRFAGDWDLSVSVGGFYTSTLSSQQDFGFKNLYGAQVQPALTRPLGRRGAALMFYGKYVPLFSFALDEREFALGAQLMRELPGNRVLGVHVDYSDIAFNVSAAGGGVVVSRNTVIGASLGF